MTSLTLQLWQACSSGDLSTVIRLCNSPSVDVNWVGPHKGDASLHRACRFGHTEVAQYLLTSCPRVNLNKQNTGGGTPFCAACQGGHLDIVQLFLLDDRIEVNLPTKEGGTALWISSDWGFLQQVQLLLASDRRIDTTTKTSPGVENWHGTTASQAARLATTRPQYLDETLEQFLVAKDNGRAIADLADEYERDPVAVRTRLRNLPGLREVFIGDLFALVVFLADGLFTLKKKTKTKTKTKTKKEQAVKQQEVQAERFFEMVANLPIEMQMVVCRRAFGSTKEVIATKVSEPAFVRLARRLK